jgi:YD repeat-containing protein
LNALTNGTATAAYEFVTDSSLVLARTMRQSGAVRVTANNRHDRLNRLMETGSTLSGDRPALHRYKYNQANQRTQTTHADNSQWTYGYDELGQVTSGRKSWEDGSPVPGQQFRYDYDDIGNRTQTEAGGDALGGNLRLASYSVDNLNQYSQRTVPGTVDVIGIANALASVQVNTQTNLYRRGEYHQIALGYDNSSAAQYPQIENWAWAAGVTNYQSGNLYIPKSPEVYAYDDDGNQTGDGRWTYLWDGENRLVGMDGSMSGPAGSVKSLRFVYDDVGRRISKVVSNWTGSAWVKSDDLRFVYDGFNLLAELNEAGTVLRSYTWGMDLSGTMQGAGGVGGLVSLTVHSGGIPEPISTPMTATGT